jgi:hypothetical protein
MSGRLEVTRDELFLVVVSYGRISTVDCIIDKVVYNILGCALNATRAKVIVFIRNFCAEDSF